MQYLAEVEKKSGGLLGGSKTALRLLACQKNAEEGWKPLSGDGNVVYTDKVGDRGSGALVMAELSGNDVRRVQSATRDIINIFKTHSSLQGKLKEKDDDIEQWKESLTYQSQELNRRIMEVEQREEQIHGMDEELVKLDQQREEVNAMREEAQRLRAEMESKQQELEATAASFEGQSGGGSLDPEQVSVLESHVNSLAGSVVAADGLQGRVQQMLDQLNGEQSTLDEYWKLAESEGGGDNGNALEQFASLRGHFQGWNDGQAAIAKMQAEIAGLRRDLDSKQQFSESLQRQIKAQSLLQKQITHLAGGIDPDIAKQIDYEGLEAMPLDQLESKVADLKKDYDRTFNFVNDQEEELRLQLQAIEELKTKMAEASEFDSLTLTTELADEQDSYRILDESMVDQRRTLHERKTIFDQYQTILSRRQGNAGSGGDDNGAPDMAPVLAQLEADAAQQKQQLDRINGEIQGVENQIRDLEGQVESKVSEQHAVKEELDRFEASFQAGLGTSGGSGDAYRAVLNPVQEMVNSLKQQFEEMQGELSQVKESENQQHQLLDAMRQSIGGLQQEAEAAASAPANHANPFSDAA